MTRRRRETAPDARTRFIDKVRLKINRASRNRVVYLRRSTRTRPVTVDHGERSFDGRVAGNCAFPSFPFLVATHISSDAEPSCEP